MAERVPLQQRVSFRVSFVPATTAMAWNGVGTLQPRKSVKTAPALKPAMEMRAGSMQ